MATERRITNEMDLSCAICKTAIKEPRITRCGHSFCRCCLEDLLKSIPAINSQFDSLTTSDTQEQSDSPSQHFEFACPFPLCGRKHRLRTADIDEFPPNCMLADIVKGNERDKKSQCKIHQKKCGLFCFPCKLEICKLCLKEHNKDPHEALEKGEAIAKFLAHTKKLTDETCEIIDSMNEKLEKAISSQENEIKIQGEFIKLENNLKVLDEATPLLEQIKVNLSTEFLMRCEGSIDMLKEAREITNIQNAIGFITRAAHKSNTNVLDDIALEQMASNLKEKVNQRLQGSSFEARELSGPRIFDSDEVIAENLKVFIAKLNAMMTKYEIILQTPGGMRSTSVNSENYSFLIEANK